MLNGRLNGCQPGKTAVQSFIVDSTSSYLCVS